MGEFQLLNDILVISITIKVKDEETYLYELLTKNLLSLFLPSLKLVYNIFRKMRRNKNNVINLLNIESVFEVNQSLFPALLMITSHQKPWLNSKTFKKASFIN